MADPVQTWVAKGTSRTVWANISTSAATHAAQDNGGLKYATFQVTGTFNTGRCSIMGTNGLATVPSTWSTTVSTFVWSPLSDLAGNSLAGLTSGVTEICGELPRFIRPQVTGVTGDTNISIFMIQHGI